MEFAGCGTVVDGGREEGGGLVGMEREGRWKRGGGDVLEDGNVRGGSEMLFLSLTPGPIHSEDSLPNIENSA